MTYFIVKRDGREVRFNISKIQNAIQKSGEDIGNLDIDSLRIALDVVDNMDKLKKRRFTVEEIQDMIYDALGAARLPLVADSFITYRNERTRVRDLKSDLMGAVRAIGVETDRDNANVGNNFSAKLLRIASETNKWHNLSSMPKNLSKRHELGDMHYHDLDSYNLTTNCLHLDTGEVLKKGYNTGYGTINPPKRIETAAELSCILLQASQNDMFGGVRHVA